jgi:hypothetical protein
MAIDRSDPDPELLAFLTERHLVTLTTPRPDGRPHVGKDPVPPGPRELAPGPGASGYRDLGGPDPRQPLTMGTWI